MAPFDDAQIVTAQADDPLPLTTRSELRVNSKMAVLPPQRSTALASAIANAPGVARAHNSLVHVRGVEDGMLYVIDGVPVTERYDLLHASAIDVDAIDSLSLLTGNTARRIRWTNGAVISIDRSPDHRHSATPAGAAAGAHRRRGWRWRHRRRPPCTSPPPPRCRQPTGCSIPSPRRTCNNTGDRFVGAFHAYGGRRSAIVHVCGGRGTRAARRAERPRAGGCRAGPDAGALTTRTGRWAGSKSAVGQHGPRCDGVSSPLREPPCAQRI